MITKESLRGEELLKDLNDGQLDKIINLVSTRIGELHGGYDKDLGGVLGIEKPAGSGSSYTFWTNEVKKMVDENKSLKEKVTKLSSEDKTKEFIDKIADLEAKLKEGATDKSLLAQWEKEKTGYTQQLESLKAKNEELSKKYEDLVTEGFTSKVDTHIDKIIGEIPIKDGTSDYVKGLATEAARKYLKETYEFDLGVIEGREMLVPKKDGRVVGDDLKEILMTQMKDIVGKRTAAGTGVDFKDKPGSAQLEGTVVPEALNAKSKHEAMQIIQSSLRTNNIPANDPKYQKYIEDTFKALPESLPLR